MNKEQLINYIWEIIEKEDGGQQKGFADRHRISCQYLGDILHGRRDPGEKLLKAMGYKKVVTYVLED